MSGLARRHFYAPPAVWGCNNVEAFGVRCHYGREGPKVDKETKAKRDTTHSMLSWVQVVVERTGSCQGRAGGTAKQDKLKIDDL